MTNIRDSRLAALAAAALCGALLAGCTGPAGPTVSPGRVAVTGSPGAASSAAPSRIPIRPSPSAKVSCEADAAAGAPDAPGDSETERLIAQYAAALMATPGDHDSLLYLGLAHYQHARETADPSDYARADEAFSTLLATDPNDVEALIGTATVALARHQFNDALRIGQQALALESRISRIYGVIGDAQNELGLYEEAAATFQTMVRTRPDLSSYSRVSYVRELRGDLDGAIEAMETAIRSGGPAVENTAYLRVVLGNLWFIKGDLTKADGAYRTTLARSPGYVFALAGVARLAAARNDLVQAIACYQAAADRVPFPEFLIGLGEAQEAAGLAAADGTYRLVRQIQGLFQANGVNTDLDLALFESDHGDPAVALQLARAAHSETPNIKTADALAWALYRNGLADEARPYAEEALQLGSREPSYAYHAGMIAMAQGDAAAARTWLQESLASNPAWSPLAAPRAAAALSEVGAAVAQP